MKRDFKTRLIALATIVAVSGLWLGNVSAADHNDPPNRVGAQLDAADIGDLYAWHSDDGSTLTLALTFSGPAAPSADQAGMYDADVLYGIHIDNNGDNQPNAQIWIRFAQNDLGEWGIQLVGLPGESDALVGAVETELTAPNGAKAWAGLRDDPFFFDLQGFTDTLQTGTLSFDSSRDGFAGQNITAVVIEVPVGAAIGGGSSLSIWATSARL